MVRNALERLRYTADFTTPVHDPMRALPRLLTALTFGALLSGCAALPADVPADTIARLTRTGSLTLGYREDAKPFSHRDAKGEPAGYSVELCRRVAELLRGDLKLQKLDVKWVPVNATSRIPALLDGTIDLECGTTSRTISRMQQVEFSMPIFVEGASFVARADSGLRSGRDLGGRRVAIVPATTAESLLKASLAQGTFTGQLVPVAEYEQGLAAVADGRADALLTDRVILTGLLSGVADPQRFRVSDDYFSFETYALAMRRDPAFRVAVDRTLATVHRSGDVLNVFRRAFGPRAQPTPILETLFLFNAMPE
jgi:ABC-type amino acid transport substrate-binding protein